MTEGADWSPPDAHGVRTREIDVGAKVTLRGRRQRRRFEVDLRVVGTWTMDWRDLLREWLAGEGATFRWGTLLKRAGPMRVEAAAELCTALLGAGLIELDEKRDAGRWQIVQLRFIELEALREQVGLPNRDRQRQDLDAMTAASLELESLQIAALMLDQCPLSLAIRRRRLLASLDRWAAEDREGTHRDFALFATGDTKGVASADWDWLEANVELAALRIAAHKPLLLIRAPLKLHLGARQIDLGAVTDLIGLSPTTIAALTAIDGDIGCWRLIENRTSFERAAADFGDGDGVVWLPGYPPSGWRDAMRRLVLLRPAPALIACDPDPAGIAIAQLASEIWRDSELDWRPWQMDADVLDQLPVSKPLTVEDRRMLERLIAAGITDGLAGLAAAMLERGLKGEQEGLALF